MRAPLLLLALVLGGLALIAGAGLSLLGAEAALASDEPLFVEVADSPLALPSDPTVARARVVSVNFNALAGHMSTTPDAPAVAGSVILNLFPDVQVTAILDHAAGRMDQPGQRLTWIGHVAEAPEDRVLIVAGDATLAASVQSAGGIYEVRYLDQGYHAVIQINQGQFGPD